MTVEDIVRLLDEAASSMKSDVRGAVGKLESAHRLAVATGNAENVAIVAEDLARGWARCKSASRSLHYARKSTRLMPERKAAWTTLAKTCELMASRTGAPTKQRRARALYRAAATSFKKASALTKDPEDKRWLQELASDAAHQAKPPSC